MCAGSNVELDNAPIVSPTTANGTPNRRKRSFRKVQQPLRSNELGKKYAEIMKNRPMKNAAFTEKNGPRAAARWASKMGQRPPVGPYG
jgi:hypothetical protein